MHNFDDVCVAAVDGDTRALSDLQSQLKPDDAINIQFTSGTTGNPKGATLSHCNILNNGYLTGEAMRLTPLDKLCIPVPPLPLLWDGARCSRLCLPRCDDGFPGGGIRSGADLADGSR